MSNWTKIIFNNEKQVHQVVLAPDFADLSNTDFPNGLRLLGEDYKNEDDAKNAQKFVDDVFSEMEIGYKQEKEEDGFDKYEPFYNKKYSREPDENMNSYGIFAMAYTDFDQSKAFEYARFLPHFVDLEDVGFPHGISIGEEHFFGKNSRKEVINYIEKIDKFFFILLNEYENLT